MEHLDAEDLSLLALGEDAGSDVHWNHLGICSDCSEQLAGLRHTVNVATTELPGDLEAPGSHNWTAIHQALGLAPEVAADPLGPPPAALGPRNPGRPTSLPRYRQWIAPVAAGLLIGAAGAWTVAGISGPTQPPVAVPTPLPVVLTETPLQPLGNYPEGGDALVERFSDGMRQLVIRLPEQ